jgi:hypothetical protein
MGWDDPSLSSWPPPASRSWTCRRPGVPGPAAGQRRWPQERRRRCGQRRPGRPVMPGAARGRRRGPDHHPAAAGRAARRPGRRAHPHPQPAPGLLRDLVPGGLPTDLTAATAAALPRRRRPRPRPLPAAGSWPVTARRPAAGRRPPRRQQGPAPRRAGRSRRHLTPIHGLGGWWRPSCWARSATSAVSPARTTSPATPRPRPWTPPAATSNATGSTPAATTSSMPPCTHRGLPSSRPWTRPPLLAGEAQRGKTPLRPAGR